MAKTQAIHTLAIDIGGSFLKMAVLDEAGAMVGERVRVETPDPAKPQTVLATLQEMAGNLPPFDRISVGFPGVVRDNITRTAPNLGTEHWAGFAFGDALTARFGKPVRIANDADVQGLGVISGQGLEMVVTLGTGFGTSLFLNGVLLPHLEIGQHPIRSRKNYDQYVGADALKKKGRAKWNEHVQHVIATLATLTNYDRLLIGGGNAAKVDIALPDNVALVSNVAGITGGIHLWDAALDAMFAKTAVPAASAPAPEAAPASKPKMIPKAKAFATVEAAPAAKPKPKKAPKAAAKAAAEPEA